MGRKWKKWSHRSEYVQFGWNTVVKRKQKRKEIVAQGDVSLHLGLDRLDLFEENSVLAKVDCICKCEE
eukprot:scaffold3155_cov97-Skeletonema_dohrnii-CCMP3373.AAC.2